MAAEDTMRANTTRARTLFMIGSWAASRRPPRFQLVDNLVRGTAPVEAIGGTREVDHQHAILAGHARWTAIDDHLVADLQRIALHARLRQLTRAAPLDGPSLHRAALIRGLDVHERVRIAIHELDDRAIQLDRFAGLV